MAALTARVTEGEKATSPGDCSVIIQVLGKTHGKPTGRELVTSQARDSPGSLGRVTGQ